MDIYGGASTTTPDNYFRIDDLLDFSNDEIFSSSAASTSSSDIHHHHISPPENSSVHQCYDPSSDPFINPAALSTDFTDHLSVPSDDVAELEWLSRFVDDSFMDFPANALTGAAVNGRSDASFPVKARGKRTKGTFTNATASAWITSSPAPEIGYPSKKEISSGAASPPPTAEGGGGGVRRCTHCASEKTPQWRTGPLGPKTLCNACGVRFKSGRLVPEYRPAASPTFVLTQHSNSHRKVMELRRQKEMLIRGPHHQINNQHQVKQQIDEQQHIFHPHHRHHQQDFEVC